MITWTYIIAAMYYAVTFVFAGLTGHWHATIPNNLKSTFWILVIVAIILWLSAALLTAFMKLDPERDTQSTFSMARSMIIAATVLTFIVGCCAISYTIAYYGLKSSQMEIAAFVGLVTPPALLQGKEFYGTSPFRLLNYFNYVLKKPK